MSQISKQMRQHTNNFGAMESRDHSKNGASPKSQMSKNRIILLLLAVLFVPISLSSQIKLAEPKSQKQENPKWWHLKDIVYAPYDSSYLEVKEYPALDAYEKYVGQQLYLSNRDRCLCGGLYSNNISQSIRGETYVWHPDSRCINYNETPCNDTIVSNKYYDIIGVLNVESEQFLKHHKGEKASSSDYDRMGYHITKDYSFNPYEGGRKLEDIIPYFILRETESGDTVYTAYPRKFILVGGFVKMQQKFIGENIFEISGKPSKYEINNNLIKDKWNCIDVVLSTERKGRKNRDKDYYIDLVLQNAEDSTKEMQFDSDDLIYNYRWTTETAYNEAWDKVFAQLSEEEKVRKEQELKNAKEIAAENKQREQQEAQRKQQLTAKYGAETANKIIAGKFEIGMSKTVCKEIASWAAIIDKTAATETWRVSYWIGGNTTYLYFAGDKLARIVNR